MIRWIIQADQILVSKRSIKYHSDIIEYQTLLYNLY